MRRGLHTVPLCALLRHASVGSREQVQSPLSPPRRPAGSGGAEGRARGSPARGGGGGGGCGGGPLVPWRRLLTAGGGGRHGSPGPGGQPSAGGSRPSPAPLYLEPDPRAGPRWGPSSPWPLSRGAGRPGAAVRVSIQWLAGCGAAGSPPRSLSPPSLPREVARSHASCHTVGRAWVGGPSSPPHSRASAVWAITCAAACVGAGAAVAAVAVVSETDACACGRDPRPGAVKPISHMESPHGPTTGTTKLLMEGRPVHTQYARLWRQAQYQHSTPDHGAEHGTGITHPRMEAGQNAAEHAQPLRRARHQHKTRQAKHKHSTPYQGGGYTTSTAHPAVVAGRASAQQARPGRQAYQWHSRSVRSRPKKLA